MSDVVKEYTCQSCGRRSTDKDEFKILIILRIGWVTCKNCMKGWAE